MSIAAHKIQAGTNESAGILAVLPKWTLLAYPSQPQTCVQLMVHLQWHSLWYDIFLCSQSLVSASRITPHDTMAFQGVLAGKGEVWQLGFRYPGVRVPKNFGRQGLGSLGVWSSTAAAWSAARFGQTAQP